jgi:hypothetical protein
MTRKQAPSVDQSAKLLGATEMTVERLVTELSRLVCMIVYDDRLAVCYILLSPGCCPQITVSCYAVKIVRTASEVA